jgi:hypothetical protein
MPVIRPLDREQIIYLLNMCDEATIREIIGEDDPWHSQTFCDKNNKKCWL